jgi:hypothetical protein
MSLVQTVTCDMCKTVKENPQDWFNLNNKEFYGHPGVIIQRLDPDPRKIRYGPGIQHLCSMQCLLDAVIRGVEVWPNEKH